jgi:hypothetical protein
VESFRQLRVCPEQSRMAQSPSLTDEIFAGDTPLATETLSSEKPIHLRGRVCWRVAPRQSEAAIINESSADGFELYPVIPARRA